MNNILKLEDFKANTKEWFLEQLGNMSAPQALQTISDLYDELHKPTYPKTYEECCLILGIPVAPLNPLKITNKSSQYEKHLGYLIEDFIHLLSV